MEAAVGNRVNECVCVCACVRVKGQMHDEYMYISTVFHSQPLASI